jgi:predicted GNAT family N-acyltransferase
MQDPEMNESGYSDPILLNPAENSPKPPITVEIARGFDDMLKVFAIRAVVFMAEQGCPYAEEFDGNDMVAVHLIAHCGAEPAATLRLRFFGDFAKMERVAVRQEFRNTKVAKLIINEALGFLARKGFKHVHGHVREGLEKFWGYMTRTHGGGFKPIPGAAPIEFSGLRFTPMSLTLLPSKDSFSRSSDPEVLNRPEGVWDVPGVLEAKWHAPDARLLN